MDFASLETTPIRHVVLAAEARIGAAQIAHKTGEHARVGLELDFALRYIREIDRRLITGALRFPQEA